MRSCWVSNQLNEFDGTSGSLQSFEKHDNPLSHWLRGDIVTHTWSCHRKNDARYRRVGGDSERKRSTVGRQGLKPSSFSPRLTSERGISPAGNFCCVNTQPRRVSDKTDRAVVQLINIWSVLTVEKSGVKCFLFISDRRSLAAFQPDSCAVCPFMPVSSVFLHFLPCERGATPLHACSLCAWLWRTFRSHSQVSALPSCM